MNKLYKNCYYSRLLLTEYRYSKTKELAAKGTTNNGG